MKLKTCKIDHVLYEHLKKFDNLDGKDKQVVDVNNALRNAFKMLSNEAALIQAKDAIAHNTKIIEKNDKRIEALPGEKAAEKTKLMNDINTSIQQNEIGQELCEIKLKYSKVLNPINEYETMPEFLALRERDNKRALEQHKKNLVDLYIAKEDLNKTFEGETKWDDEKNVLEQQNMRARKEIARWRHMLEGHEMLKFEE